MTTTEKIFNYLYTDNDLNTDINKICTNAGVVRKCDQEEFKHFMWSYLFEKGNSEKLERLWEKKELKWFILAIVKRNLYSSSAPYALYKKELTNSGIYKAKIHPEDIIDTYNYTNIEDISKDYQDIEENILIDKIYDILWDTKKIKWWEREFYLIYMNLGYKFNNRPESVSVAKLSETISELTKGKVEISSYAFYNIKNRIEDVIREELNREKCGCSGMREKVTCNFSCQYDGKPFSHK